MTNFASPDDPGADSTDGGPTNDIAADAAPARQLHDPEPTSNSAGQSDDTFVAADRDDMYLDDATTDLSEHLTEAATDAFEPQDVTRDVATDAFEPVTSEIDTAIAGVVAVEVPSPQEAGRGSSPGSTETLQSPADDGTATDSVFLHGIDPDVSDDELLAAASASLHDDVDTENPTPGAGDPNSANEGPAFDASDLGVAPTGPTAPGPAAPGPAAPGGTGQLPPHPSGPPPGYPQAPPVRRVYRSRHDRKLGGVSAGIAEFFGIDPTLVRLGTLVAAFTGVGVLVYIAAWFIIPLRPEGHVEAPRPAPVANERTMTLAFGIAALALAFGITTGSWAVLAIALIGGGVWLLSEHTALSPGFTGSAPVAGSSSYQPPSGFEPGYVATPPPTAAYVAPASGFVTPPPPPAWQPTPPRERKPQRITWTILSLLALLTAVGLAASTGDWWDVSATRFLGIGVVIIGVGVVIGQLHRGGARGLIPLGILAALALFPVSAVDGLLDDGVGEATYRPTTIAELQNTYEHGIGQLVVDLSELDFAGQTESVDVDLGIGELIVIVSDDTGGQAVLKATAGEVSHMLPSSNSMLFEEGVNVETGTVVLEGENGTLDLNISVGLGTAELRSEAD